MIESLRAIGPTDPIPLGRTRVRYLTLLLLPILAVEQLQSLFNAGDVSGVIDCANLGEFAPASYNHLNIDRDIARLEVLARGELPSATDQEDSLLLLSSVANLSTMTELRSFTNPYRSVTFVRLRGDAAHINSLPALFFRDEHLRRFTSPIPTVTSSPESHDGTGEDRDNLLIRWDKSGSEQLLPYLIRLRPTLREVKNWTIRGSELAPVSGNGNPAAIEVNVPRLPLANLEHLGHRFLAVARYLKEADDRFRNMSVRVYRSYRDEVGECLIGKID